MSDDEALSIVERVFEILATPVYDDFQKATACMAFLRYATPQVFAEYPRECKAIVAGAFEYGASWKQVAEAASIDIAEAKRRWTDVARVTTLDEVATVTPLDEEWLGLARRLQDDWLTANEPRASKAVACLRVLEGVPLRLYSHDTALFANIVSAALHFGASWEQIACAARIDVAEAQRRWGSAAPATVAAKGPWTFDCIWEADHRGDQRQSAMVRELGGDFIWVRNYLTALMGG